MEIVRSTNNLSLPLCVATNHTPVPEKNNKISLRIASDIDDVNPPKKSELSDKEVLQLVDLKCPSSSKQEEEETNTKKSMVSLTGTILSPIDVPLLAPVKLAVNVMTTTSSTEELAKNVTDGDILGTTTSSISSVKNSWGTAVSAAKLLELTAESASNYKLFSTSGKVVSNYATKFSAVATKVALPFAVVGTVLSGVDTFKEGSQISERKDLLKKIDKIEPNGNISKKQIEEAKTKVNNDIKRIKVNTSMKGVSFALSAVSTGALIMSVKKPSTARIAIPVSIASSLVSGLSSAFSNSDYRKATSEFVSDKWKKIRS